MYQYPLVFGRELCSTGEKVNEMLINDYPYGLHVYQSTPEKWTTTEFSSTVFSELLHTTEFSSTSVFSATPEIWSTTEFMSTEYIFMDIHSLT